MPKRVSHHIRVLRGSNEIRFLLARLLARIFREFLFRGFHPRLFKSATPRLIRCTIYHARCTMHDARCTMHDARCTMHDARWTCISPSRLREGRESCERGGFCPHKSRACQNVCPITSACCGARMKSVFCRLLSSPAFSASIFSEGFTLGYSNPPLRG